MKFSMYNYSNDPFARYEVYVPDGTGNMAQQLLTLPEIRSLLARQSDSDDFDDAQQEAQEKVSLAGGKVTITCARCASILHDYPPFFFFRCSKEHR